MKYSIDVDLHARYTVCWFTTILYYYGVYILMEHLYILQGNVSTSVIDQRDIPHTQIELNSKTIAELVSCNSATTQISTELEW